MKCFFSLIPILFLLIGCSPYIDSRREAGVAHLVGQSHPPLIAVCYNGLVSDEIELQNLANAACSKTKKPAQRIETRYFNCTLLTPNTAIFRCSEKTKP